MITAGIHNMIFISQNDRTFTYCLNSSSFILNIYLKNNKSRDTTHIITDQNL